MYNCNIKMQQFYIFKFDTKSFRQFFKGRGRWSGRGREESSGRGGQGEQFCDFLRTSLDGLAVPKWDILF